MRNFHTYRFKKILSLILFAGVLLLLLFLSKENFESVKSSVMLFLTSVLPSLFPFILFTEIVLHTDVIDSLSRILGSLFSKLFHVDKNASSAIIIGFLCGFPMGSKAVSTLYEQRKISKKDADVLLTFVNNCNPAFILSTIAIGVFYHMQIGILLLISHLIASLLIGIFYGFKYRHPIIHENGQNLNSFTQKTTNYIKKEESTQPSFFVLLKKSILNAFVTLGNILGFIIIFNLLFHILSVFLTSLQVPPAILATLSGIFEITNGSHAIYLAGLTLNTTICLVSFVLGFSGLCIIAQIYSTICDQGFKLLPLLKAKGLHGILSCLLTYILLMWFPIQDTGVNVFSSMDMTGLQNNEYVQTMKASYLCSAFAIIGILALYYFYQKRRKNRK